jgi:hypothetical protein
MSLANDTFEPDTEAIPHPSGKAAQTLGPAVCPPLFPVKSLRCVTPEPSLRADGNRLRTSVSPHRSGFTGRPIRSASSFDRLTGDSGWFTSREQPADGHFAEDARSQSISTSPRLERQHRSVQNGVVNRQQLQPHEQHPAVMCGHLSCSAFCARGNTSVCRSMRLLILI